MKFVAIDFETANQKRESVCAVGMVTVENGQIVEEFYSLVDPEDRFSSFNIDVHGITPRAVSGMPTFPAISGQLWPRIAGNLIVAHNAAFDINVLKKAAYKYRLTVPEFSYVCTCQMARLTWTALDNHRLSTIANYLSLDLQHHNALSDAKACANIFLKALQIRACKDMRDLGRLIKRNQD